MYFKKMILALVLYVLFFSIGVLSIEQFGMEEPPNTFPNLNILSVFVIYWLVN